MTISRGIYATWRDAQGMANTLIHKTQPQVVLNDVFPLCFDSDDVVFKENMN
jgi:hypothetical protein